MEKAMTRIILTIAMLMGLAAPALAQAGAEPPRPYRSEMRGECEAELAKDKAWEAELKNSLRPEVHEEDAALILRNKKHVVMAYAAVWILTVVFLVLLWLRQRRLLAEIDRLGEQVKKAAES